MVTGAQANALHMLEYCTGFCVLPPDLTDGWELHLAERDGLEITVQIADMPKAL